MCTVVAVVYVSRNTAGRPELNQQQRLDARNSRSDTLLFVFSDTCDHMQDEKYSGHKSGNFADRTRQSCTCNDSRSSMMKKRIISSPFATAPAM